MSMKLSRALLVLLSLLVPAAANAAGLARGPYLQRPGDSTMTVAWYPSGARTTTLSYRVAGKWVRVSPARFGRRHHARLSGLEPGTRYLYKIEDGAGRVLTRAAFTTAPRRGPASAIRFAAVGDSGTGSAAQYLVAEQMRLWRPDLIVHTGDVVYPAGEGAGYPEAFFLPYRALLPGVPLVPSVGNHDALHVDGFRGTFLPPEGRPRSGSKRYFSFDYGNAHFTVADTTLDLTAGSAQRDWIEADLERAAERAGIWRIVFFHHPPYSAGPHGDTPAVQRELVPLFERWGVDAVFSGHDHAYERTDPHSSTGDPATAVLYVVTGGGGAGLYARSTDQPLVVRYFARHHFVGVALTATTLSLQAIAEDGTVLDEFGLSREEPRAP